MDRKIIMIDETLPHQNFDVQDDSPVCDNDLDYEEVLRRQDDIDQLTADYLSNLVHPHGDEIIDLEPAILEQIENRFEEVLADEFGIYIYRPIILRDENGAEYIAESAYDSKSDAEDYSDDWGAGIDVEDFG